MLFLLLRNVSAAKHESLRTEECRCKSCGEETLVALLRESRTVTTLVLFSRVDHVHRLACASCRALFVVPAKFSVEDRPLAQLMELSGEREFPPIIWLYVLLWLVLLPTPLISLVMALQMRSFRVYFHGGFLVFYRMMFLITLVINAAWAVFLYQAIALGPSATPVDY